MVFFFSSCGDYRYSCLEPCLGGATPSSAVEPVSSGDTVLTVCWGLVSGRQAISAVERVMISVLYFLNVNYIDFSDVLHF